MKRKGVSAELIRTHVDEADEDWVALAIQVRSKRFGNSPPVVFREKARQARFLQYRGFTTEQIQAALAGSE
jgi:regulatory protein